MLSRQEYERVISNFFVEMNRICSDVEEDQLRSLPRLAPEIDSYLEDSRDPNNSAAYLLRLSFAYLDAYCWADWDKVVSATYEAYKTEQSRNGA